MESTRQNERPDGPVAEDQAAEARELCAADRRLPWVRPVLACYGDVRQLTMGGSFGNGESSSPLTFHP